MVIAMLLAHLVGDYILQWDRLAQWKARELKGVLLHGAIVWLVAQLFALPFDPAWWPWALFIGVTHTTIDAVQLPLLRRLGRIENGFATLLRFTADQALHLLVIIFALVASGYLQIDTLGSDVLSSVTSNRWLSFALAYAFISIPTWILVHFLVYPLVEGSAPDFSRGTNKYVGTLERWLIATFVLMGQFMLVPLVTLPRVFLDERKGITQQRGTFYVAELLASVMLAVAIGMVLRIL